MGRPILSPGKKLTGGKFRPVTPGRRQPKTLILSTNVDQNSIETEFSIVICRPIVNPKHHFLRFLSAFVDC